MRKILPIPALLALFILLFTACFHDDVWIDDDSTPEPGTATLTLQSSNMTVTTTRADDTDDTDPEYYMGTTYLFFYTDTTQASIYTRSLNVNSYNKKNIHWVITDDEVSTLFPGTATECTVYAVSNVPSGSITEKTQYTLSQLRQIALSTDFSKTLTAGAFAMDGKGTLTLDRTNMTLSGEVTMERALAKISMELNIASSIEVTEGDETVVYEPVLKTAEGKSALTSTLCNSVTNGLLNGSLSASKRKYTTLSATYEPDTLYNEETGASSIVYTQAPYYSYPNEWAVSYEDNDNPYLKLTMAWRKSGESAYTTYYYRLPLNDAATQLVRNHHYLIKLTVGMLGTTDPNNPLLLTASNYEILDWGYTGEEGESISASIDDCHFLVAEDKEFTIYNEDELTFSYNTCYKLEGVYLTAVSYESTKLTDSSGNPQTVYLYNTTYNSSKRSYSEVTNYTDNDKSAQSSYSTVVSNLKSLINAGSIATFVTEYDDGNIPTGEGTVTFNAPVNSTANLVYRPLTYTLVLANTSDHQDLQQTVKITQYPSKYVEYGDGGSVFVNGYYALLDSGTTNVYKFTYSTTTKSTNTNGGPGGNSTTTSTTTTTTTEETVDYYLSYPFIFTNYTSVSNNSEYTGYYSSTNNQVWLVGATSTSNRAINYGYVTTAQNRNKDINDYKATNTSYEYIQSNLQSSLTFTKTLDVHVSAFTSADYSFSIKKSSGTKETHKYILGDPRTNGGFTSFNHNNESSYVYEGSTLYDYYVKGSERKSGQNTYYDRYVKAWDNADKIKVSGTTTDYDDIIAPVYKIQSSYGATIDALYFDVAQKRCATYQEAGYPAGRWRIPTLAEIAFIIGLQEAGVIKELFISNKTGYWTSSKGYYDTANSKYYNSSDTVEVSNHWVRCVYDLWYWQDGDEKTHQQKPVNKYYPYPTRH